MRLGAKEVSVDFDTWSRADPRPMPHLNDMQRIRALKHGSSLRRMPFGIARTAAIAQAAPLGCAAMLRFHIRHPLGLRCSRRSISALSGSTIFRMDSWSCLMSRTVLVRSLRMCLMHQLIHQFARDGVAVNQTGVFASCPRYQEGPDATVERTLANVLSRPGDCSRCGAPSA
jgi:hypothetical protein